MLHATVTNVGIDLLQSIAIRTPLIVCIFNSYIEGRNDSLPVLVPTNARSSAPSHLRQPTVNGNDSRLRQPTTSNGPDAQRGILSRGTRKTSFIFYDDSYLQQQWQWSGKWRKSDKDEVSGWLLFTWLAIYGLFFERGNSVAIRISLPSSPLPSYFRQSLEICLAVVIC